MHPSVSAILRLHGTWYLSQQRFVLTLIDTPGCLVPNRKHLKAITVLIANVIVKASLFCMTSFEQMSGEPIEFQ